MKVKICDRCEGRGSFLTSETSRDGHREIPCKKCNSTGRLLTKTYKIEVPFGGKPTHYRNVDEQIIKMIQNLRTTEYEKEAY